MRIQTINGFAALATLTDPKALPPNTLLTLADTALLISVAFAGRMESPLNFSAARFDSELKRFVPVANGSINPSDPGTEAGAASISLGAGETRAGALVVPAQGLPFGEYVLVLGSSGAPDNLEVSAVPFTPAAVSSRASGAIGFESFVPGSGNAEPATPSIIVTLWDGRQDSYAGTFKPLPRPTTALLSASADYDGGPVVVEGVRLGKAVTDTITPKLGGNAEGSVLFDSFTGMRRVKAGTKGNTSLGYGGALGLRSRPSAVLLFIDDVAAVSADYTLDQSQGGILLAAAKLPDGKRTYKVIY